MKKLILVLSFVALNSTLMAKEIKTQIVINAPAEKVWAILTNFEAYPTWNPFIKSISGEAKVGNKIKAHIVPPNALGMTFTPKVLTYDVNKKFTWLGHLMFTGLFDGEHSFELIQNADGTTTFIQSEKFKGILVPLFKKMLDTNTVEGFNLMNQKLKELAEK